MESVRLAEIPRLIRKEEADAYYDEYSCMSVANADCVICGAKYLAWCSAGYGCHMGDTVHPFYDLSYRSTFDDEPGREDIPSQGVYLNLGEFRLQLRSGDCWAVYRPEDGSRLFFGTTPTDAIGELLLSERADS
jgi:hypothetical protein